MTAQTLTLTTFLLDRYAEEEAGARAASEDFVGWMNLPDNEDPVGVHIQSWAPQRVLAEVAAKRAIVGIHRDESLDWLPENEVRDFAEHPEDRPETRCAECSCYGDCVVRIDECRTLRALASVYACHPLYRSEWKL